MLRREPEARTKSLNLEAIEQQNCVMMISLLTKPNLLHRVLAIVAMVVLLTGRTIHVHQECADCCGSETQTGSGTVAAVVTGSQPTQISCKFGCDHHVAEFEATNGPVEDSPPPSHDESSCAVCSVLAAAPDFVLVLGMPEWADLVQPAVLGNVSLPDTADGREIRLRGPPIA